MDVPNAVPNASRWRAGGEVTMSEYDRRTGVKQLRVRELRAVRFCAVLKAIGNKHPKGNYGQKGNKP